MAIFGHTQKRLLDPEQCFTLWAELGTLEKVRNTLYDLGILNPLTGISPNLSSIRSAALNWILAHPKECYMTVSNNGENVSWEEYELWLVYKAIREFQSETRMRNWLMEMDLYDSQKYRRIYDYRYPNLHERRVANI